MTISPSTLPECKSSGGLSSSPASSSVLGEWGGVCANPLMSWITLSVAQHDTGFPEELVGIVAGSQESRQVGARLLVCEKLECVVKDPTYKLIVTFPP